MILSMHRNKWFNGPRIMRKEYGKALHAAFEERMHETFPDFLPTKVQSKLTFPGERYFCRSVGDRLRLWVILVPSPKAESFTVEVGWSRLGRFPELSGRPSSRFPSPERTEFAQDEYFARLASLWTTHDPWWEVEPFSMTDIMENILRSASPVSPEAAREKVAPAVEDAIEKLRVYGVPYLTEFQNAAA